MNEKEKTMSDLPNSQNREQAAEPGSPAAKQQAPQPGPHNGTQLPAQSLLRHQNPQISVAVADAAAVFPAFKQDRRDWSYGLKKCRINGGERNNYDNQQRETGCEEKSGR